METSQTLERRVGHRGAVLLDPDDRFEQEGQDPLAVDAGQRQGDLGLDHAELDAEVVPGAAGLEREVRLAPGQGVRARS